MAEKLEQTDRERRAGRNQALFREVNERLNEVASHRRSATPPDRFICECAHDDCFETMDVSLSEYETIRDVATRFFVAPSDGHFIPEVERVLDKNERFWVVEKLGQSATVAEKLDPRSRVKMGSVEISPVAETGRAGE
jgi:hypothetical protein